MWQCVVDWDAGTVEMLPLRQADKALNIVSLLEPPAGVNLGVKLGTLIVDAENHTLSTDVFIKHPVSPMFGRFNGFDVRGIVFGPELTNADGMSAYFNPDDFTGTPYGYIDGLLGVPDMTGHYSELFNGYKYFCDDLGPDDDLAEFFSVPDNLANRGIFTEGTKNSRFYELYFGPNPNKFMVFNYAVYASHAWPKGPPPFDIDAFDVTTANQAEPVFADVTEVFNSLTYNPDFGVGMGAIGLNIDVFDWLKPSEPNPVWIEAIGVIPETQAVFVEEIDEHYTWYYVEVDGSPLTAGQLDIVITIEDETTYDEHYFMNLLYDSHPLYGQEIITKFVHHTTVEEYSLFPFVEPFDGSGEEWILTDNWTLEEDNSLLNNQDDTDCYAAYLSDAISPQIPVPQCDEELILMMWHTVDVENDYDEMYVQFNDATMEPVRGMLYNDDDTSGWTGELSVGWSAFELGTDYNGDWLEIRLVCDADGSGQCQSSGYYGWQIHHLILGFIDSTEFPPIIETIDGPNNVGTAGPHTYTADIFDYNGLGIYDYYWEIGDDDPPEYDDGPGNGDGSIDITFPSNGNYIVNLRIGHPDGLPVYTTTPLMVTYFEVPPNSIIEDFEDPLGSEWSFHDLSTSEYGEYWGLMDILGEGALDVDGDDNGCYQNNQFSEARWEVTIPASGNAVLMLRHLIDAEIDDSIYCYDGGMVAIDSNILTTDALLCGWENRHEDGVFTGNTGGYTEPAGYFAWSGENPSYPSNFDSSYLDISAYADGNQHTISLLFDSDASLSCEDGESYTSWSIAEIGIFYD